MPPIHVFLEPQRGSIIQPGVARAKQGLPRVRDALYISPSPPPREERAGVRRHERKCGQPKRGIQTICVFIYIATPIVEAGAVESLANRVN